MRTGSFKQEGVVTVEKFVGENSAVQDLKAPLDFTTRSCGQPYQEGFQWLLGVSSHKPDCRWTVGSGDSIDFILKKCVQGRRSYGWGRLEVKGKYLY